VTDGAWKSGYTCVILVDLGVKVDRTYYYDLLLSRQLLPVIRQIASKFIFQPKRVQHIGHAMFSDINISKGSAATRLMYGGTFIDKLTAKCNSERILKIDQYLAKLCVLFF